MRQAQPAVRSGSLNNESLQILPDFAPEEFGLARRGKPVDPSSVSTTYQFCIYPLVSLIDMDQVAVFVDAGYFWVQLAHLIHGRHVPRGQVHVDYDKLREYLIAEVERQVPGGRLLRMYWYDGPALSASTAISAEHRAINELDDFKLRLGLRGGDGQQKGVDGLLITDLMLLTQRPAISHAILVTGDADIAPAVQAVQSLGVRVHLISFNTGIGRSQALYVEADMKRCWAREHVENFLRAGQITTAPSGPTPDDLRVPETETETEAETDTDAELAMAGSASGDDLSALQPPGEGEEGDTPALPDAVAPTPDPGASEPRDPLEAEMTVIARSVWDDSIAVSPALRRQIAAHQGNSMPQEIDWLLLNRGKAARGRLLDDIEKRALRSAFRTYARTMLAAASS